MESTARSLALMMLRPKKKLDLHKLRRDQALEKISMTIPERSRCLSALARQDWLPTGCFPPEGKLLEHLNDALVGRLRNALGVH